MKKETLEEAAENYSRITLNKNGLMSDKQVNGFIAGANWQVERMYSKEDMKLAFETGRNFQLTGEDNFNELIEQFKKK
jgi:hypothetical protein